MPLRIACPILALPVWLVGRFAIDSRSGRPGPREVVVNIGDMHDQPRAGHVKAHRRTELVFHVHAVKPDRRSTNPYFAMNRLAVGPPLDASWFEAERLNQKVMSRLDISVH
jgi:hypothetical protein